MFIRHQNNKLEMKENKPILALIGLMISGCLYAQSPVIDPKMDAFIGDLMSRMTLEEKIGQLNLLSVGFDVTGPVLSKDAETKVRQGLVGGVFNTYTPQAVRKLQSLAVKESRLGIPLLFGYDVIHGHKTIFPIPLGLSCTWNLDSVERSARIAAAEASADGVNWTFSPMVDIARDAAVGKNCGRSGGRPVFGRADRPGDGAWLPGRRPQPKQRADGVRQTFCLIRRGGGGPRLQHGGYEPPQDVPVLSAAVPGGGGGWRRQRHEFLQ